MQSALARLQSPKQAIELSIALGEKQGWVLIAKTNYMFWFNIYFENVKMLKGGPE